MSETRATRTFWRPWLALFLMILPRLASADIIFNHQAAESARAQENFEISAIVTGLASDQIATRLPEHLVVAIASEDAITASTATDEVVTLQTPDDIVAVATPDDVTNGGAGQLVITGRSCDRRRPPDTCRSIGRWFGSGGSRNHPQHQQPRSKSDPGSAHVPPPAT